MQPKVDEKKLNLFLEKMLEDIGAAMSASLVVIGDKLGLYKVLAQGMSLTPNDLAKATGTNERYVREWLANQAAGGYVTYNAKAGTYSLSPEQAALLADETSAYFIPGAFEIIAATVKDEPRIEQRSGAPHGRALTRPHVRAVGSGRCPNGRSSRATPAGGPRRAPWS